MEKFKEGIKIIEHTSYASQKYNDMFEEPVNLKLREINNQGFEYEIISSQFVVLGAYVKMVVTLYIKLKKGK